MLGALTAVLLWRFRFPFKAGLEGALALPIVVPEICMGVAMLVFFTKVVPWPQGAAVAAEPGRDRHRPRVVLVQLRGGGDPRAPRRLQPRAGGGGARPRGRAVGRLPRRADPATCAQRCWRGRCSPSR